MISETHLTSHLAEAYVRLSKPLVMPIKINNVKGIVFHPKRVSDTHYSGCRPPQTYAPRSACAIDADQSWLIFTPLPNTICDGLEPFQ